jgi:hypothetical protein
MTMSDQKKAKPKKLLLKKESLRVLTSDELKRVQAGMGGEEETTTSLGPSHP